VEIFQAKNLVKRFGQFTAVDGVSFALGKGEILGLLGRNGAGKTTTLQMALGALTPTAGEILYFGKDLIKHRQEILERVNFSSTYTFLPYDLRVWESLNYTSFLYDISDRKAKIREVIQSFKLEDLAQKQFSELSAGQKTRVNLAKAFLNSPEVLLLDEPTASMDPATADEVRKFILKKREEENISVIFTSHNMAEIEEVCDRVIFIDHGKILSEGTPKELAGSLDETTVKFLPKGDNQKFLKAVTGSPFTVSVSGNLVVFTITEKEVAGVFRLVSEKGLEYREVSIEHSDLEDYFVKHFGEEKSE